VAKGFAHRKLTKHNTTPTHTLPFSPSSTNTQEEIMTTTTLISELRKERDALAQKLAAVETAITTLNGGPPVATNTPTSAWKLMSPRKRAAAKRKLSNSMKRYWARMAPEERSKEARRRVLARS
jgi:hypothetical protein